MSIDLKAEKIREQTRVRVARARRRDVLREAEASMEKLRAALSGLTPLQIAVVAACVAATVTTIEAISESEK